MSLIDPSKATFSQPILWPSFNALYEEANRLYPDQGEDFWWFVDTEIQYKGISKEDREYWSELEEAGAA